MSKYRRLLFLHYTSLGRGLVEKANVEYICLVAQMMQKLVLSQPSFCCKDFDFALRKTCRIVFLDYFPWFKITCAEEVGGALDYKAKFQRRDFSRISCMQFLRNVRKLRTQNKKVNWNFTKNNKFQITWYRFCWIFLCRNAIKQILLLSPSILLVLSIPSLRFQF